MWSKKSEISASGQPLVRASSGWWDFVKANAPLPVLLIAIFFIAQPFQERVDNYYQRVVMLIGFNIILAVSLQLINGFSGQFSLGHAGFMAVGAYLAAYPAINLSDHLTNPCHCAWFFLVLSFLAAAIGLIIFLLYRGIRLSRAIHRNGPVCVSMLLVVWLLIDIAKGANYQSPPLRFVWTNLFSIVSNGFDGLLHYGAPMAERISTAMPAGWREPLCFLVLVAGGGCCAAVVGLIVGLPALRLRGDYLAIATLGMAEIIRIVIQNSQPLGGALGLTGIPKYTSFPWLYCFVAITIIVMWRIAYSAKGRAIMAVREDEIAASAVGINTTHQKVMAFVIGSFFGGVAGALFALHERSIAPYQFGLQRSIEIVVMVTLGGLGSISGAVVAAVVLTILLELLRDPQSIGGVGWIVLGGLLLLIGSWSILRRRRRVTWGCFTVLALCSLWELGVFIARRYDEDLQQFRMIIYSLSLILMMLLRPQGLLGGVELWPRRRRVPPLFGSVSAYSIGGT